MSASPEILRQVPPSNPAAEQAVLGAVIVRNELFEQAAEIVRQDDFHIEKHREIWQACEALAAARQPIDAITLTDVLRPHL